MIKNNIKLVCRRPVKICRGIHYKDKDQRSRELNMLNYDFKMERNQSSLKRIKFSLPNFRWIPYTWKTALGRQVILMRGLTPSQFRLEEGIFIQVI